MDYKLTAVKANDKFNEVTEVVFHPAIYHFEPKTFQGTVTIHVSESFGYDNPVMSDGEHKLTDFVEDFGFTIGYELC